MRYRTRPCLNLTLTYDVLSANLIGVKMSNQNGSLTLKTHRNPRNRPQKMLNGS